MQLPKITSLYLVPAAQDYEATIVALDENVAARMDATWWNDPILIEAKAAISIDRHWSWMDEGIEYQDMVLVGAMVAIVTGDDAVQGAMHVSTQPIASHLSPGEGSLFVERLFAAPWNRRLLRTDDGDFFLGSGVELLTWAVELSRELGCSGRIRLESSPEAIDWYTRKYLQILPLEPIVFEGINYIPMELSSESAIRFLDESASRTKARNAK